MSDYPHSPLPIQNIPPPTTHTPIKNIHLPHPTLRAEKKCSPTLTYTKYTSTYHHQPTLTQNIPTPITQPAIGNVQPPLPTQNIPSLTSSNP